MLFTSLVAVVAVFLGAVAAQNSTSNITIDPNSIDPNLRASWCTGQRSACSELCDGDAPTNLCTPDTLTYSCLCTNGSSPDLQDYINTLPDYICEAAFAQCIAAHPNDLAGQTACNTDIKVHCGFLDLANFTAAPSSSSAAPSTSSSAASSTAAPAATTGSSTGSATAASASATKSGAAVALSVGQSYGAGALAAGAIAAFGYLL